jgi:hypothetical protein
LISHDSLLPKEFRIPSSTNRVAEAIRPHGFFVFTNKAEGQVREKEGWVGGLFIALFKAGMNLAAAKM